MTNKQPFFKLLNTSPITWISDLQSDIYLYYFNFILNKGMFLEIWIRSKTVSSV